MKKCSRAESRYKRNIREELLRILLRISAKERNVVPDGVQHVVRTNDGGHVARPHHSQQRVKFVQQRLVTPAENKARHQFIATVVLAQCHRLHWSSVVKGCWLDCRWSNFSGCLCARLEWNNITLRPRKFSAVVRKLPFSTVPFPDLP